MPRLPKKQKRKLKHISLKSLTICFVIISIVITARTAYVISPLPFDEFQDWRASQMEYVFAAFAALLIANVILPSLAIRKGNLKLAALLSALICVIPFAWLVVIFAVSVS